MLSIMVISFFNLAIDSCSFPFDKKSLLNPGIIPYKNNNNKETKITRNISVIARVKFERRVRFNFIGVNN